MNYVEMKREHIESYFDVDLRKHLLLMYLRKSIELLNVLIRDFFVYDLSSLNH